MSKIDWINIFKLSEVNQYCGCDDLVQLSMVCKVVRVSLRNTLLNTFNFNSFTNSKEYKSCIIDSCQDILENDVFWIINPYKPMTSDLIESKKRFKSDLILYGCNIDKLNLTHMYDYFYLVYEIPNVFQNVKSLVINNAIIMHNTIQYLMDNLSYLEEFGLCESVLHKQFNESKIINSPITLKRLNIQYVAIGHIEVRDNNAILRSNIAIDEDYTELELSPINLPNLLYIRYRPYFYEGDRNDLLQFLTLNQSINYLFLIFLKFDPVIFNMVKSFKNLIKLEYDITNMDIINTNLISPPANSNIKSLSVYLPRDSGFLGMLAEQLPNLTDLYITNAILEFNQLWSILPRFKKLKSLKLKDYAYKINSKELNSQKFSNLEIIELVTGKDINFEVLNIDINSFPKLKLIKFALYHYHLNGYNMPKVPKEVEENWELVYFPRKLSFYRIGQ